MLDLRKPAGFFFLLLGVLLAGAGILNPGYMARTALANDVNLNLYFGLFCICFGGVFLWLSRKA